MNEKIIKILHEMSELYAMDDVPFKPQAYEKATRSMDWLEEDIKHFYKENGVKGLEKIPGIGSGIAKKIKEYIETGHIEEYEKLKKKIPVDISEVTSIEGVGPKLIKLFYKELNVRTVGDLEKAARAGKISSLPRCGEKLEQRILKGIEFYKKIEGRFLLDDIYSTAKKIEERLRKLNGVKKVVATGSFRRQKETVGDLDIIVSLNSNIDRKGVVKSILSMSQIKHVYGQGIKKVSVRFKQGFDVDFRLVEEKSFGSALLYFTGSKAHNIKLRRLAIEKGFKLNEYGIKTEEEVYKKLGLQFIPPEMREDLGEIELALRQAQGKPGLPELVEQKDLSGELHVHAHWNVRKSWIRDRVGAAQERGYKYIGISDHTKFLAIEHGLNEKELLEQAKEIKKLNKKGFKVFHGCEANILADGSIDIEDEVLEKLDYVIAGVHSKLKMPKKEMTERIIKAMENPHVDIISHPTGRVLNYREPYELDFNKILEVAKRTGTVLEINSNPLRLDLKDTYIKKAKEAGVKMVINSDAHQDDQMDLIMFGVGQARRGWCEKNDVINTMTADELSAFFKKPKNKRF